MLCRERLDACTYYFTITDRKISDRISDKISYGIAPRKAIEAKLRITSGFRRQAFRMSRS